MSYSKFNEEFEHVVRGDIEVNMKKRKLYKKIWSYDVPILTVNGFICLKERNVKN